MRKKKTNIGIISLIVLCISALVMFNKQELKKRNTRYEEKIKILEEKIKKEEERGEQIKNKASYQNSQRYIEEIAREKLGLVYEDEIILKAE